VITTQVDEAGKIVYKLPNYMAAYFSDIFAEVDQGFLRFGIKSYSIRNMTLEQVFLSNGDQESKKDEEYVEDGVHELIDELPPLTKPSCFGRVKALVISTGQSYL